MKTIIPLAAAAALLAQPAIAAPAPPMPGEPAPAFTLKDCCGQSHSLSDFKGKYVVLEWINLECPFVKKHYGSGNMQALQKEFTAKGVVWLSISSSAPGKQGHMDMDGWMKAVESNGAKATAILMDADGATGKAYGARVTPEMVVIDPEGKIIYRGAIDSIKSTNPEDVAKATNYVRGALEAALAGKPVDPPSTEPYGCSVKY